MAGRTRRGSKAKGEGESPLNLRLDQDDSSYHQNVFSAEQIVANKLHNKH